jgi:hypothetical protein
MLQGPNQAPLSRVFHQNDDGMPTLNNLKLTPDELLKLHAPIPRDEWVCDNIVFGGDDDRWGAPESWEHTRRIVRGSTAEHELIDKIVSEVLDNTPPPAIESLQDEDKKAD